MALRCERCRTADLTLETFGVYRCSHCGRVDADGNLVDRAADADDTGPQTFDTERASFAAPPPPPAVTHSAPSAVLTPAVDASGGLPTTFLATLAVVALIDIAGAVASHSVFSLALLFVFYGGLLTGKSWARTSSMAGAVLTIGLCAMAFVVLHGSTPVRLALVVVIAANAWWIYVLVRPDTVRYFTR